MTPLLLAALLLGTPLVEPAPAAPPAAGPAAPAPASPEVYRERLERILARPEFRGLPRDAELPQPPPLVAPPFLKWVSETLGDALGRFLDWLVRKLVRAPSLPGGGASWIGQASGPATWTLVAGAAALLGLLLWRLRRAPRGAGDAGAPAPAAVLLEAQPDALARPADAWARFAEEFSRKGEWRLALRAAFLRLLVVLHERGAIRYERPRTNGEYAAELAGGPAGEPFSALALAFDEAWYGNKPLDETRYRAALGWTRAVDRATRPRGVGP